MRMYWSGATPCRTEVEHLHSTVVGHDDIGRFQVAVHDSLLVCRAESLREGDRDLEDLIDRHPAVGDDPIERSPFDQLHGQELHAVGLFDRVHRHDARMVESGKRLGLAAESLEPLEAGRHLPR